MHTFNEIGQFLCLDEPLSWVSTDFGATEFTLLSLVLLTVSIFRVI